ncbi:MAG: EamA family transporter [Acidobacteriaceae bacterium]
MSLGGSSSSMVGLGLGTAAAWGAADFAGGLATKRAAPAFVVAVAHGFSLLLLYLVAVAVHAPSFWNFYGFLSGVFCGGGLIALYAALSRGSMGLSAALSGVIAAVFPVVYSWLREGHPTPRRLAGFAIAAVAIWMVAYVPDRKSSSETDSSGTPASRFTTEDTESTEGAAARSRGLGLAVLAGLSFGAMLILMNLASAQGILWPLIDLRIASSGVGLLAGISYWLTRRRKADAALGFPTGKLLLLALVAGVLDTSGNLIYFFASQVGRLDVTAVLASLYPASTMLLAAWVLKERATRSQVLGMVLALGAVVLIAI